MLTLRTSLITALFILVFSILTGCRPMTSSGIPKALNTDTLLQKAGKSQGITLAGSSSGEGWDSRSIETDRSFHVTVSSGTSDQLLAAYRQEVEHTITNMSGEIHGTGIIGGNVREFTYDYTWAGNDGLVRVYLFDGSNGNMEIVLFCYEHRN